MTASVIGLGGRLRAGKDCIADHLVAEHGFKKIGMSDSLHQALLALDPIIECMDEAMGGETRYSEAIKKYGYTATKANFPEARALLQRLGTEVGRDMIGVNTWVNITAQTIDNFLYADQPVVVTGIRFMNELRMIDQFAGRSWWVDRPDETADASIAAHASENGVQPLDFDSIILNDGSLADLYRKVNSLL